MTSILERALTKERGWHGGEPLQLDTARQDDSLRIAIDRFAVVQKSALGHLNKPFPVHFGVLNDDTLNAVAFKFEGEYAVAVNRGTVHLINKLANLVLSDQLFMMNVCSAASEDARRATLRRSGTYVSDLGACDPVDPISPGRRVMASLLSSYVLDFVYCHELAHILNGHVDLLNANNGLQIASEKADDVPGPLVPLDWQTIEMDADATAIMIVLQFAKSTIADHSFLDTQIEKEMGHNVTFVFATLQILLMLFKLFEGPLGNMVLNNSKYPPPRQRFLMIKGASVKVMHHVFGSEERKAHLLFNSGILQSELCFARIFGGSFDENTLIKEVNGTLGDHTKSILRNWRNLRPRLLPFAKDGHLAPVKPDAMLA